MGKARDQWVHAPVTSSLKKSPGGKGEKDSRGIRMGCALKLTMPGGNLHFLPELGGGWGWERTSPFVNEG